jgi:hypothetical protein
VTTEPSLPWLQGHFHHWLISISGSFISFTYECYLDIFESNIGNYIYYYQVSCISQGILKAEIVMQYINYHSSNRVKLEFDEHITEA